MESEYDTPKKDFSSYLYIVLITLIIGLLIWLLLPEKDNTNTGNNGGNQIVNPGGNNPGGTNPGSGTQDGSSTLILTLNGDEVIKIKKGDKYEEPGYTATDSIEGDLTTKVTINGQVNTSIIGSHHIIYKVENSRGEVKQAIRIINVEADLSDVKIKVTHTPEKATNEEVKITLKITGDGYDATTLPNGKIDKSTEVKYKVSKNGTYTFKIERKDGKTIKQAVKITNIDKEGPTGSCTNKLELSKTYVEVKATDALSDVVKYTYNNGKETFTSKKAQYTYNGVYKDVSVTLFDKFGNKSTIKCVSSGTGATDPIKPPTGANIIRTADSDTLKVSIEKKSSYYITRVWVLDPYNQINKGLILENWNKQRSSPTAILNHEIKNRKLSNKIVVGINASGFYENGSWSPSCSSSYLSQYNRTTEGPLVIYDGKVIRNWSAAGAVDQSRNHSIYTISKEGNFEVYQNFNSLSESARKKLFDSIVSKGYRDTWTFRPVIILNGVTLTTSMLGGQVNKRSIVCQIDRNNWAIISGTIYTSEAISVSKNMGCKTVVNMDGGGSVSLHFKSKSGALETIYGGTRAVVDTMYFTEG